MNNDDMDKIFRFGEILADLMNEKDLNNSDMHKLTGISDSNISHWIKYDKILPSVKHLVTLSDFLNCSIDYLTGRTNIKQINFSKGKVNFQDRLQILIKAKGISFYRLGKEINVGEGQPSKWLNGAVPSLDTLIKLADYFDCSIDYLIGRSDNI